MTLYDMKRTTALLSLCAERYDEKTFQHCLRVAKFAAENVCLESEDEKLTAYQVALAHDLIEDTTTSIEEIAEAMGSSISFVENVLSALTKGKTEKYVDYIIRLKKNTSPYPYIVKLADMKDHLTQTDTLTDKLREKHIEALPYLL